MRGMDWYSRKVLAWRLSNSMDADFYVEALKEALAKHGTPEVFNSDQGSQFTSGVWIHVLTDGCKDQDQHRWKRRMARQPDVRKAVAAVKVRMRLSERLWHRFRYACRDRQAAELL